MDDDSLNMLFHQLISSQSVPSFILFRVEIILLITCSISWPHESQSSLLNTVSTHGQHHVLTNCGLRYTNLLIEELIGREGEREDTMTRKGRISANNDSLLLLFLLKYIFQFNKTNCCGRIRRRMSRIRQRMRLMTLLPID